MAGLLRWGLLGLAGLLAGCNLVPPPSDDPTRYFVLSEVPAPAAAGAGGLRVGIRAIRLDGYLKRREMVVRTGANEVEFRDYRRWAEPLDEAVARVVRSGLLASGSVSQVWTHPFPADQDRDYDVSIEITRCEGLLASGRDEASVAAVFEIWTTGVNPHSVARKAFTGPAEGWDGRDFDRLTALLSSELGALGRDVAAALPPKS
jgi:uncharacterized lipoprotein YmbA